MTPSFARDIRPLFTDEDVDHMKPHGLDLSDYESVKGHKDVILDRVSRAPGTFGIMPPPPRDPWTQAQVQLFRDWIDGGTQP
jgi:hypothetical protein